MSNLSYIILLLIMLTCVYADCVSPVFKFGLMHMLFVQLALCIHTSKLTRLTGEHTVHYT